MALLDHLELETGENPTAAVIWLHGLGANGHDFAGIVPELKALLHEPIRFIFPHAPARPVTINGGYVMPAWFDILNLEANARYPDDQIEEARLSVRALMDTEHAKGIAYDRMIIAGFSQGGALALVTGLKNSEPLAGVIALSTGLGSNFNATSAANHHLTIFQGHGTEDDILSFDWGRQTYLRLKDAGHNIEWHEYPMGHSVNAQEIKHIATWINEQLAIPTTKSQKLAN